MGKPLSIVKTSPRQVNVTTDLPTGELEREAEARRMYFCLFDAIVQPGDSVPVSAQPQAPFKAVRLAVDPKCAEHFFLYDIKVGKNSQRINGSCGVRCTVFPPIPNELEGEEREHYEQLLAMELDTADISQYLTIYVRNNSDQPQHFNAVFWGHAVE